MKQVFLFTRLTSDHMHMPIYLQEPFASAMSYSRPPSCNHHGNFFFASYFLNQLNAKRLLQNQLS